MSDYRLELMAGVDIPLPELKLVIHVPTVKDIALMGEARFFQAVQYICLDKEALIQDENVLSSLTNFQVLVKVLDQSQDKDKKAAVLTLLKLLFPEYQPMMTKKSIILPKIGTTEEPILIDESNFDYLQEVIKQILCVSNMFQGENIVYNPVNARAKEIADKLTRARRKIAQIKSAENSGQSVLTRYVSILTVGINSMSLSDCLNLNLFQLFDLMDRYTGYVEWDTDMRVRLAGGKPEKQVESWMKDLHPKT